MPRRVRAPSLEDDAAATLAGWSESPVIDRKLAERAKIVLMAAGGAKDPDIADALGIDASTAGVWRRRFLDGGIPGLFDPPRGRRTPEGGTGAGSGAGYEADRDALLDLLRTPPPEGLARWDQKTAARALGLTGDKVWRILRREGVAVPCRPKPPEGAPGRARGKPSRKGKPAPKGRPSAKGSPAPKAKTSPKAGAAPKGGPAEEGGTARTTTGRKAG